MKDHRTHRPETLDRKYDSHSERQGTQPEQMPDVYLYSNPKSKPVEDDKQEIQKLRQNYRETTPERDQDVT